MSLDGFELGGDTSVEMADYHTVDRLNSTRLMHQTGTQSSCAPRFRAWSFRLTIKADFAGAVDKRVKEHISERTTIHRPFCVASQIAFYYTPLLSAVPDSDGLVSIALHGFVQTRNCTRVRTMSEWIEDAVWTPVPCGLASDDEFKQNMQRFSDANDSWTQPITYGSVGMNNNGREAQKTARKVGSERLAKSILDSVSLNHIYSYSHVFTALYGAHLHACDVRPAQ